MPLTTGTRFGPRGTFRADKPRLWPEGRFSVLTTPGGAGGSFDLHPDGERVAVAPLTEARAAVKQDKLVFIFNFFDELRRIAPPKQR